jgi:hypothetical protein
VLQIRATDSVAAEVSRLSEEVTDGERALAALHDTLEETRTQGASATRHSRRLLAQLAGTRADAAASDAASVARREHVAQLENDIRALEEGNQRLEGTGAAAAPAAQAAARAVPRRYITGLSLHGRHVLILLDVSASMLHEDLVTILKLRNEDDAHKRAAAKWRRALAITDWLLTQVPAGASYQVLTFNTQARALGAPGWLAGEDREARARAMAALETLVPANGTSLYNAFAAARALSPAPDQIVLITDGLPTQGRTAGVRRYVNSGERMKLFDEAVTQLPEHVPVDSVLLPMKGDLQAAHRFWHLARVTDGTLLMPAKDWP